jgi:MoxR-like ATPase
MNATLKPTDTLTPSARAALNQAIEQVNQWVLGKAQEVRWTFAALLAGGHVLIEDLPGLGKTTLARAMAASLGLGFQRMQFTADLLPSDILGVSIFDQDKREFRFHPGPVFTQLLLADEINRAPPRTQSALLEAMAEQQATVDGVSRPLPDPFFVIATQNPVDLTGTFPLPDSQLDRFLIRFNMGYPDASAERALLGGEDRRHLIDNASASLKPELIRELKTAAAQVHASSALIEYVQALLHRSRHHPGVRVGLSPRAGIALINASKALALINSRNHVLPDDVQELFDACCAHRLVGDVEHSDTHALALSILQAVKVD